MSRHSSKLHACVMRLTAKEKDSSLLTELFPDIAFCPEHQVLVESHLRSISVSRIDMPDPMEACAVCPKRDRVEIDVAAALQQKPKDLKTMRIAWVNVLGPSKTIVIKESELLRKSVEERKLWFDYMAAAYAVGEQRSQSMIEQRANIDKTAEVNKYEEDLKQFYTDCQLRGTNGRSKKDVVCQQLCVEHDMLGDFVPYRPMTIYQSCTICERPKRPRKQQASGERLNERQMFSNVTHRES